MRLISLVVVSCLLVGCDAPKADTSAADKALIDKLYADWRLAVEASDIPRYLTALHPDVRLLPPGADPIVGAANYGKFLEPVFASADYKIEVLKMPSIDVMGDVATVEYEYLIHLTLKNPDVGITEPGALTAERSRSRYFDVLKKDQHGRWAIWRHTWHTLAE